MDWLQTLVLALLQGVTEFLPISSSAHLILVPVLLGWPDQGLAFDVAVHVGTLLAVVVYFRAELTGMARAWFASLAGRGLDAEGRLAWGVLLGTIPVGLAGLAFKDLVEGSLRGAAVIATTTVVFGLLLGLADRMARPDGRSEHQLTWRDVLLIGLAQAVALIPGTSRSGITMTAGLFLGLSREGAARFSFLLSIPVIVLAGGLEALELVESAQPVAWGELLLGVLVSFVSALLVIHFFLRIIARMGMMPFVVYRLLLGALLVVLLLLGRL